MAILLNDFLKLQNGSDIRGVACEGIEGESVSLTAEAAYSIGQAFALWLMKKKNIPADQCIISVGTDSRVTGPALKDVLIRGMLAQGIYVSDCGMASTPAMFMSIVYPETRYDGAVMITASHLPFNRNGFKFFDKDGGLDKADIKEILTLAAELSEDFSPDLLKNNSPAESDRCVTFDLLSLYAANLCLKICDAAAGDFGDDFLPDDYDEPLKGLRIVVDAGNGAGGFFAREVLAELGADITGSSYLDPDGMFPNHIPNPENKEAMQAICKATVENHADLGLIFDTDVDRMSAVLSDGTPINRDSIIAMISSILAPEHPGATIVTDSVTSDRLTEFLEQKLGLKHLCYMRGYKNVINKCKELNKSGIDCPLAMETSGHGCLKENYYLDDGAFLAVKLVIAVAKAAKSGKTIDHLIAGLSTEYAAREVRFPILAENFSSYGASVLEAFKSRAAAAGYELPASYEGIRVRFTGAPARSSCSPDGVCPPDAAHPSCGSAGDPAAAIDTSGSSAARPVGWLLLRASLHDPVMVLNLEGRTEEDLTTITKIAAGLLKDFERLDQTDL